MGNTKQSFDVFISHGLRDRDAARHVAQILERAGVSAFFRRKALAISQATDEVWEALATASTVVAILSSRRPPNSLIFEIGAASAWNKPVLVVRRGVSPDEVPDVFKGFPAYTPDDLKGLVQRIQDAQKLLSDHEIQTLVQVYQRTGIPSDQLARKPAQLQHIVTQFRQRTRKPCSGEALLSEILRLRKRGLLPALRRMGTTRRSSK